MEEAAAQSSDGTSVVGSSPLRAAGWQRRHVRLVAVDDGLDPAEQVSGAVFAAGHALDQLSAVDPSTLGPEELRELMEGVEALRSKVEATAVRVAGHLQEADPFAEQGFLSPKATLKHMCKLSGPEAHRRLQTARLHRRLPDWARAERAGVVGVAQSELMAQVAASGDISDEALAAHQADLLDDAISLPYDEFEARLRTWEGEADAAGDRESNERRHAERDIRMRPHRDGGWTISGRLGELQGAELNAMFAKFIEAEWQADWAEARERLGDEATTRDLRRNEPQRRADAWVKMARQALAAPPGSRLPTATINLLIDEQTFEDRLTDQPADPGRYRDIVCRTQDGRRVHPDDVVNRALVDHVRRVVYDTSGTVIDLGRRVRLFRGAAREAVMLLATTCAWVGCDRPVAWCQADHSQSWRAHGSTVPRNGCPLCAAHNQLKERGYQVSRDDHGDTRTIDPDGNEIT